MGLEALKKNPNICITNPAIILKLLRNFGNMLINITVNFRSFSVEGCVEIENYLAEYCSNSLELLSLSFNPSRIVFQGSSIPFIRVIRLRVEINYTEDLRSFLNLNGMFPNIQYLFFQDYSGIQYYDTIAFGNMEHFSLYTDSLVADTPISFNKLKHFCYDGRDRGRGLYLNDNLYKVFSGGVHLKTLDIKRISLIDSDAFAKLLKSESFLSNVQEIKMELVNDIPPDCVVRYLAESHSLQRLTLYKVLTSERLWPFQLNQVIWSNILRTIISSLSAEWKYYVTNLENPKLECHVFERVTD